ncbi:MAG: flagellar hook-length control protein FliK [Phycisphaerae bacterium]|nr:flagellar hook-length control protein FliK [Phycisphaerae bacterium]
MGLGLFSAEVFRPVGVEPSDKRRVPSVDQSVGVFDDYLADARSLRESARSDEPERPRDQSNESTDEADESTGGQAASGTRGQGEQSVEPSSQSAVNIVGCGCEKGFSHQQTVGSQADTPRPQQPTEALPELPAGEKDAPPIQPIEVVSAQGTGVGSEGDDHGKTPAQGIPRSPALASVLDDEAALPQEARGDRVQQKAVVSDGSPSLDSNQAPKQAAVSRADREEGDTSARREEPAPSSSRRPAPRVQQEPRVQSAATNEGESPKAVRVGDGPGRVTNEGPQPAEAETLHDLKMKASIEQRRLGSADGQGPRPQTNGSGSGSGCQQAGAENGSSVQAADRSRAAGGYVEMVTALKAASAWRGGSTDAAASVGRFLAAGAEKTARSSGATGGSVQGAGHGTVGPGVGGAAGSPLPGFVDGAAGTVLSHSAGGGAGTASTGSAAGGSGSAMSGSAASNPMGAMMGEVLASELVGPDGPASAARVLSASGASGRFQVAMQLEPPELGQLRLNIHMQQQAMTLHVDVESQAVAKLIESRLSELRDALAAHGVRVDRADVVVRSWASGEPGLQQHGGGQGNGGESGHRASGQSGAETPGGGNAETGGDQGSPAYDQDPPSREHGLSATDVAAWRGEGTGQDSQVEYIAGSADVGLPSATKLSLDLVA